MEGYDKVTMKISASRYFSPIALVALSNCTQTILARDNNSSLIFIAITLTSNFAIKESLAASRAPLSQAVNTGKFYLQYMCSVITVYLLQSLLPENKIDWVRK
jgi:hypothetical protein